MSAQIKSIGDREQIIKARVQGVQFGETLEWENLKWIDSQEIGDKLVIGVKGDADLAASLIADMAGEFSEGQMNCSDIHLLILE